MRHFLMLPVLAALAGCVSVGSINADTLGLKGNVDTKVGVTNNADTNTTETSGGAPDESPTTLPTLAPTPLPTLTPAPSVTAPPCTESNGIITTAISKNGAWVCPTPTPVPPTPTPPSSTPDSWANATPTLTSVGGSKSALTLKLSVPIFLNSSVLNGAGIVTSNYIFVFGKTLSDVSGIDLAGVTPKQVDSFAAVTTSVPLVFAQDSVTITPNPNDLSTVTLAPKQTGDALDSSISAVKVRVINVERQAVGNQIVDDNTTNVQQGLLQ